MLLLPKFSWSNAGVTYSISQGILLKLSACKYCAIVWYNSFRQPMRRKDRSKLSMVTALVAEDTIETSIHLE